MKDTRFFKFLVLINAAVPLALLGYDALNHRLGANPVNFSIRTTGMLALIFLTLSLAVTPARKLTGANWLLAPRRTLGLYAFFYAAIHFSIFFGLDQSLSIKSTGSEIVKRPYLLVGMLGLTLMMPLAVTSTNKMIQRLGAKRWQALHRLAYLAAIAGVVHYYMLVKADISLPVTFAAVLTVLLGYRLVAHYLNLRAAARAGARPKTSTPAVAVAKPKFWKGKLKVARTFDETPSVRTFRLVPLEGGSLPFDYKPGQYLNFSFPINGKKVNRSYSIASSPTRNSYCEITVKREEMGVASGHLHGQIKAGDVLDVSGPAGVFTFTGRESESVVLIGAGVGITPLMSKIRALTDRAWPGDIFLLYSVRTAADIIFREELDYLQKRFPNLKVCLTVTRDPQWTGRAGRIDANLVNEVVPNAPARRFHLCGPTEMTQAAEQMLRDLGVPDAQIHSESFTPGGAMKAEKTPAADVEELPAPVLAMDAPADDETGAVTFSKSGKTVPVAPDQSILDAADACGVEIPSICRAGICGTCKIKRVSGEVTMETEDALDANDRAKNLILACQAHPVGAVTVLA